MDKQIKGLENTFVKITERQKTKMVFEKRAFSSHENSTNQKQFMEN